MTHNLAAVEWCTALQEAFLDHERNKRDSSDGFKTIASYLKGFQDRHLRPDGTNEDGFYYPEDEFARIVAGTQKPMDSIMSLHEALFPSPVKDGFVYNGLLYTDTQIDKLAWIMLDKVQRIIHDPKNVHPPVEPDVASMIADTVLFDAAMETGAQVEEAAFTGSTGDLLDAVKNFMDVLDLRQNLKRPFVSVQQDDEEAAFQMALRNSMTDY
jgi:hypothetical protein